MATETVPFTREGFQKLKLELEQLKTVERPKIIREIADARSHGDLSENAEYHAAKEKQGFIEGRIADLDDKLSRAQVIEPNDGEPDQRVRFGSFVTVTDEDSGEDKTYRIVGDLEADLEHGMISMSSPLARALLGKRVGDLVEVRVPKGTVEYSVTEIRAR
ncbi:MAG: transcription elongation factor GreA [Deltaproteobacteria bacterium]|nr:transcription elongation factor GreA [Deltaproteobacteria bacterium]